MNYLKLSVNYNFRLCGKYFFAFRLDECNYYDVNKEYEVYLGEDANTCTGSYGGGDVDGDFIPGGRLPDPPHPTPGLSNHDHIGTAKCISKIRSKLAAVQEHLCYVTSCKCKNEFIDFIEEVYENENVDFENDYFAFYLFEFQEE